jgi:hypothetical protein
VPIAFSAISEIVHAETEYLKTKQGDYQWEKAFLQRMATAEVRRASDRGDECGRRSER